MVPHVVSSCYRFWGIPECVSMVGIPSHMAADMAGKSQNDMVHILTLCLLRLEETKGGS